MSLQSCFKGLPKNTSFDTSNHEKNVLNMVKYDFRLVLNSQCLTRNYINDDMIVDDDCCWCWWLFMMIVVDDDDCC